MNGLPRARELVRYAEPGIEYIRGGVAHHDVRGHVPSASWHCGNRAGGGAEYHELGSPRVFWSRLDLFECRIAGHCVGSPGATVESQRGFGVGHR